MWALYAELGDRPRESLSDVERQLLAILDLRQEVNAGGFDAYLRGWGGDSALDALQALPGALGQPWADLLDEAVRVVGSPYPEGDPDERGARLDADPGAGATLDALDHRLYALEAAEDVDARLGDFLRRG